MISCTENYIRYLNIKEKNTRKCHVNVRVGIYQKWFQESTIYKIKMKNIMVNKKVQRKKNKIFLFALKHERKIVSLQQHGKICFVCL